MYRNKTQGNRLETVKQYRIEGKGQGIIMEGARLN
jgi:hypothetical protein